jgi:cytochrome c oxidase subunit 2
MILWPARGSEHATEVDLLIGSFGLLVLLLSAPVFVLMIVYMVRFRRGREAERGYQEERNVWLETSWAVIPFLLVLGFYVWSTSLFLQQESPPDDTLTVNVFAKQWMWKFQHAEGAREINELHVPAGRPIRLVLNSQDVIHSLYLPAMRIKQDVVPGMVNQLWFTPDRPGTYPLRCAEFCGTDHSVMGGELIVMEPSAFARWLAESGADRSMAQRGEMLFRQLGCAGCHAPDASVHAPSLVGLYGSPVPLSDGSIVIADEQYIHDSIMLPNKEVAAGYEPIMPPFGNVLEQEQVGQLQAYIKSLGDEEDLP